MKQINIWFKKNWDKDLINFYVDKYVIETLIKLNLLMKNDV
jgi:hypothetical protein